MKKQLTSLKKEKDKLLLHCCCAPCSIFPIQTLGNNFKIVNLWYNPNIYDNEEYIKRKINFEKYSKAKGLDCVIVDKNTSKLQNENKKITLNKIEWQPGKCEKCYEIRIIETIKQAKKLKIPNFSLTLIGSPFQDRGKIVALARSYAKNSGLNFVKRDFLKGFYEGKKEAKALGLYLQKYCGCIKSKQERKKNET